MRMLPMLSGTVRILIVLALTLVVAPPATNDFLHPSHAGGHGPQTFGTSDRAGPILPHPQIHAAARTRDR